MADVYKFKVKLRELENVIWRDRDCQVKCVN